MSGGSLSPANALKKLKAMNTFHFSASRRILRLHPRVWGFNLVDSASFDTNPRLFWCFGASKWLQRSLLNGFRIHVFKRFPHELVGEHVYFATFLACLGAEGAVEIELEGDAEGTAALLPRAPQRHRGLA